MIGYHKKIYYQHFKDYNNWAYNQMQNMNKVWNQKIKMINKFQNY